MKVTAIAAVAASACLVSASPLRVVVVSSTSVQQKADNPGPFAHIRMGHAVAAVNPNVAQIMTDHHSHHSHQHGEAPVATHRRPCGGYRGAAGRFRQATVDIANKFRATFGLPLIEDHRNFHHGVIELKPTTIHGGMIQILPANGGKGTWVDVKGYRHGEPKMQSGSGRIGDVLLGWTKGGDGVEIVSAHRHPHDHTRPRPPRTGMGYGHGHGRFRHHAHGETSFLFRLQTAVMSLGPWEGRAVAFVIGAGIGVLLRMFWVLGLVACRGMHGSSSTGYRAVDGYDGDDDDEDGDDEVVARRQGTPLSAPPVYVYPIDEKAVYEPALPVDVKPVEETTETTETVKAKSCELD